MKKYYDTQESCMSDIEMDKCDQTWNHWYGIGIPCFMCITDEINIDLIYEVNKASEEYLNTINIHSFIDRNL